ncbi:L-histidine N(alpha)-methyltransferase [Pseudoxanthomonas sp.]|uniref:L-histidine N(alpha)-methyltransferase n=1 Tax=Pseudoxanthomonas sp. TaxID=1871049 RepID=UPI00261017A1|nr:L-histidine N(alpha)-methyltransferase [Pseudoxanthomonas sp.]WDS34885.1 MAG: L-histidine N(alpha)-methyltransferase [Pseudoxanthomonas sp.]
MNAAASALMRARSALTDLHPLPDDIAADAVAGLSKTPKTLPSKYFYDAEGSRLFEAITRQPEYYLTGTELALLEASLPSIAQAIGPGVHVVEYGSGSGRKTELLLESLHDVVAYTAVEISRTALIESTARLSQQFPQIEMLPVCADFTRPLALPGAKRPAQRTVMFFPGSTLGNFTTDEAARLLVAMRQTMGAHGCALIGIDLDKDDALIEAAYNDAAGVTAQFTLNLLARLNREIGSDFDLGGFRHKAVYARERGRIETFLVSQRAQSVQLAGRTFDFAADEAMQVEYSHKYTDAGFNALATHAGLRTTHGWNDARDWFGLRLLQPA